MDRFNIPTIREFYGATEGNCSIINVSNKVGCIGYVPVALPRFLRDLLLPVYVIRVDPVTMKPIRDDQGLCIITEPGMDMHYKLPILCLIIKTFRRAWRIRWEDRQR